MRKRVTQTFDAEIMRLDHSHSWVVDLIGSPYYVAKDGSLVLANDGIDDAHVFDSIEDAEIALTKYYLLKAAGH